MYLPFALSPFPVPIRTSKSTSMHDDLHDTVGVCGSIADLIRGGSSSIQKAEVALGGLLLVVRLAVGGPHLIVHRPFLRPAFQQPSQAPGTCDGQGHNMRMVYEWRRACEQGFASRAWTVDTAISTPKSDPLSALSSRRKGKHRRDTTCFSPQWK